VTGGGSFTRKIDLYDVDLTWLLTNKLALVGGLRYNKFGQTGTLTAEGDTGTADFGYHTLGIEGGLQIQFNPRFSLTGGYRYEKRSLTNAGGQTQIAESNETETAQEPLETINYTDATVRRGVFGNLKFDALKNVKLTFDFQHGNYDDPFTLMSPTSTDRFRATFRYQLKGFNLSATYLTTRTKNETPGGVNFRILYTDDNYTDLWKSSNDQFTLRAGYTASKFNASVGYTLIDFKVDSDRLVAFNPYWGGPEGTFPWAIHYQGKSTLLDASVGFTFDANWKIGAYINSYKNSGFWPMERTMFKGYLEYAFLGGFVSQVGYRYYNFKETDNTLIIKNNYAAGILEISFGYRWQ
jgi:outer membrane receptor protein involved in Fe transport